MQTTTLYRFYDVAGDLLYVGITGSLTARLSQHSKDKWWFDEVEAVLCEHFDDRDVAQLAERQAIQRETPRYNGTSNRRSQAARRAALIRHSRGDGRDATRAARKAFLDRFEKEVDPDGVLPPDERRRRADRAKRAYFIGLRQRQGSR